MLNPSRFRTTTPLANLSVAYGGELSGFIADQVFPNAPVESSEFKYYCHDMSILREEETQSEDRAEANVVDYDVFTRTGSTKAHKLKALVIPKDAKKADRAVANMRQRSAKVVMRKLMAKREAIVAAKVADSANYVSTHVQTLAGGSTFAEGLGEPVTLFKDLRETVRRSCGITPTVVSLSRTALEHLRVHPDLLARVQGVVAAQLSDAQILNLLGMKRFNIAEAMKNTGPQGGTDSLDEIWSDTIALHVESQGEALEDMSFGKLFTLEEFWTRVYQWAPLGGKEPAEYIESGWEYGAEFTAVQSESSQLAVGGAIIKNAY
jgi:hypothetical protein